MENKTYIEDSDHCFQSLRFLTEIWQNGRIIFLKFIILLHDNGYSNNHREEKIFSSTLDGESATKEITKKRSIQIYLLWYVGALLRK